MEALHKIQGLKLTTEQGNVHAREEKKRETLETLAKILYEEMQNKAKKD